MYNLLNSISKIKKSLKTSISEQLAVKLNTLKKLNKEYSHRWREFSSKYFTRIFKTHYSLSFLEVGNKSQSDLYTPAFRR